MTKLILDLDTGIDDTLALLYALASPEAELIGIAGTFGNVSVETGVANDLALLELFGRPDIPVFAGIDHPSWADSFSVMPESRRFHGRNGTGDVEIPARARAQAQTQSAVDFIVDAVRAMSPEDLIVIPTGASTNIAAALEAAPDTVGRARIVMMGGSLTQPGNVTPFAEANIMQDPEASSKLFAAGAQITIIGLDVTTQVKLSREQAEAYRATGTATGTFLSDMLAYYIDVTEEAHPTGVPGCNLHDPLAVAAALDPSLIDTFSCDIMVETEGAGRGRTIGDPARVTCPSGRTQVALAVDAERFVERFMERTLAFVRRCP
ncbi:nucleoside hydrolase [uncultured Enorma sp.]|uniref:nucleoside hydrolase n=1 Tax=uncultured Enorma sp. TaxID=1714346 RepID=UPI002605D6B2|nr:nucleoside hydrolase [uncultured Enorma sp.]